MLATIGSTVVLEDLNVKGMTKSARGTVESPGKNMKQRPGLNRRILQSGWSQLAQMLAYKCFEVIMVPAAYTSQMCNVCGIVDAANRMSQSKFMCVSCGHTDHADLKAAANILASGIGASARGGVFGLPISTIPEMGAFHLSI